MATKHVPVPTPETRPFWDGCASSELRLQWCADCARFYFPPQPWCPLCLGAAVEWRAVSGRGTLHSYVISHVAAAGFEDEVPYSIAIVELDEGPRMLANIVGIEATPENLVLDMALEVTFEARGGLFIPNFTPGRAG
jgi:uncharacterized protein